MMQRGEIDIEDRERLAGALRGALAATSQVTGSAYFSAQGGSLRVGRGEHGPLRPSAPHERDADGGGTVQADRERDVSGQRVAVRGDIGGRVVTKNKKGKI